MANDPRKDRNHFRLLNKAAKLVGSWVRLVRMRSPALHTILQIMFWLLLAIATYLLEQFCERGWTVMVLLAIVAALIFLAAFAFDYASAQRINYQFFWKPWILVLILIFSVMFLGFRLGYQKTKNEDMMAKTNDFFGGIITNLKTEITSTNSHFSAEIANLNGQLSDAKHDRDHYQEMLAPFEAYAIAKYTNVPIDQRIELYGQTLSAIANELASEKPVLHLEINGIKPASYESPKFGDAFPNTRFLLNTNRDIPMKIYVDSEVSAEHITVDFIADIDPTNIVADQWRLEPKSSDGRNHWNVVAFDSWGATTTWSPQTIVISQNFKQQSFPAMISIHADHSKIWTHSIYFMLQK